MTRTFAGKSNAGQAAERLNEFYSRRMKNRVLARIWVENPAEEPRIKNEPQEYDADADMIREREPISWKHLDWILKWTRETAKAVKSRSTGDGLFAVCEPAFHFEGGIETAILGGEVQWLGTKYHTFGVPKKPLIENYKDFDWQLPGENNEWFRRFLESFRYMVENANGEFAVGYMCACDGMNLAVQLRGTEQAYLDMYEHPDDLHRLIKWGYEFNKYLYDKVMEIIGPYNERLYDGYPLKQHCVIPRMSVDAYSLCAPETLTQWGLQELSDFSIYAGGTEFHIHENCRHIIEEFVRIENVLICHFTDGIGYPSAFDARWDICRRMADIPVSIDCSADEFIRALSQTDLPGNTFYNISGVKSINKANEIMKLVVDYHAPAV